MHTTQGRLRRLLWYCCVQPSQDVRAAMDVQVVCAARPVRAMGRAFIAGVVTWWLYVPAHELLHALGCAVTGGTVKELQIAPAYGAALLARVFPFVTAGGAYAGRLTGFDTHGSDFVYLATDGLPFLLTILLGVPLLKGCANGERPAVFGAAVVLALAPFYCLPGDYYEMGAILVTRAVAYCEGDATTMGFAALRSDDVVQLINDLWTRPDKLQLRSNAPAPALLISAGLVVGAGLAFTTYALGAWWFWYAARRMCMVTPGSE